MRRPLWAVLFLAAGFLARADAPVVSLEKSYEEALAAARKSGKPVLVEICVPKSKPSGMLDRWLGDPAARDLLAHFHLVRIDPDERPDLLQKATEATGGSIGYPARLYVDADGMEVNRSGGVGAVEGFCRELKRVLETGDRYQTILKTVADNPQDLAARTERFRWSVEKRMHKQICEDGRMLLDRLDPAKPEDRDLWEEVAIEQARALGLARGDPEAARKLLTRYLEAYPKGAKRTEAVFSLGNSYRFGNPPDMAKAADCFKTVLETDPGHRACYNARVFFRENPDQVKRLGMDPKASGIELAEADSVYTWVDPEKAYAQAEAQKKLVFIYAFWPG